MIAFFSFLLMHMIRLPRWSAPKEGENVTAQLLLTGPGPGNTHFILFAYHDP